MQILRSLFLSVILVACAVLPRAGAQDETPGMDQTTPDASASGASPTDLSPAGDETTPAAGRPNGGPGGGHHGGGNHRNGRRHEMLVSQADSAPLAVRVAYRRAKTIALARDPGLADLIHEAAAARTDVDKRAYLKEYYTRLFASINRIDPSKEMKAHVILLTFVAEQRYDPKRREVGGDEDLVNGAGRGRRGRIQ